MSTHGDDLDDGLEYSYSSENESQGEVVLEETDIAAHLNGDIEEEKEPAEEVKQHQTEAKEEPEKQGKKRKRANEKLKDKKKQRMELEIEAKLNLSTSQTDKIAEFFDSKIAAKNPDLSPLELSELYIPKSTFKYSGYWKEPRNLDGLQKFLEINFKKYIPDKASLGKKKKNKEPEENRKFVLILSLSAIRVCDVHRATKEIAGSSVKLILKNKLADDMKLLKSTRSRVLASTPARIAKILATEGCPLKVEEIKQIILDSSYLDPKKKSLLDAEELLTNLKDLAKGGAKIHLY